jgi:hypothetical protein
MQARTCDNCGGRFTSRRSDARFCSSACRARASEQRRREEEKVATAVATSTTEKVRTAVQTSEPAAVDVAAVYRVYADREAEELEPSEPEKMTLEEIAKLPWPQSEMLALQLYGRKDFAKPIEVRQV